MKLNKYSDIISITSHPATQVRMDGNIISCCTNFNLTQVVRCQGNFILFLLCCRLSGRLQIKLAPVDV